MNPTQQVTYTTIKEHRLSKRLWLEGKRLADIGFVTGAQFSAQFDAHSQLVTLTLDPEGDRKVSGRTRKGAHEPTSIIDICNQALYPAGTRVRAVFSHGLITVSVHHEDRKQTEREQRLVKKLEQGLPVSEAAMCVGIGVSTLATHQTMAAWNVHSIVDWVVDVDGRYLQVAIDNNPAITDSTVIFEATMEELEPELLTPVDILSVSLPCTGHSISGKSKNKITNAEQHGTAATSVFGFIQGVKAANPSVIFSENVTPARDSMTYELIRAELRRLGYDIWEYILDGKDAGTIEQRERYFFTAVSRGLTKLFKLDQLTPVKRIHNTIADILEPVPEDSPQWSNNTYLQDKAVRDKAAGKGFARQLVTPEDTRVGTIGRHYNKRRSTEPFLTRDDGKERLFTPVEACRMKRIPEYLVDGVPATVAHEGQGQSVLFTHITQLVQPIAAGLALLRNSKAVA